MQRNKYNSKGQVTALIYKITDTQARNEVWFGFANACVKHGLDIRQASEKFLNWMPKSKANQTKLLKIHNSNSANRMLYGYAYASLILFNISVDKSTISFLDWIDPKGITDHSNFRRAYFLLNKYYKQYRPTLDVKYKPTQQDFKELMTEFLVFNTLISRCQD